MCALVNVQSVIQIYGLLGYSGLLQQGFFLSLGLHLNDEVLHEIKELSL